MSLISRRVRVLTWAVAAGLSMVAIAGGVALLRPRGVAAQIVAARVGTLLVQVQCDGTLEAPTGGELRAEESGLVAAPRVHDGDRVAKGQLVVKLEDPELESQASEARAEALRLAAEDAVAAADLTQARSEVDHWKTVVAADGRLVEQGAITRAAREEDELALDAATGRAGVARRRLATLRGPASRLAIARASVAALARRVASLELRAGIGGVVYGLPDRPGERIEAGQLVASIVDPDHPTVRLHVDQPDLPRIAVGQRVVATFGGLPERQWEGRVVSAAQALRAWNGREVGEVLGELADPEHALPLNASIDAQIVVAERQSALTVPRAALYRQGGRRFVYVLRAGRARQRDVAVGLVGLNEVQITAGLGAGDGVVLAGEVPLREGLRVAPVT
jgi:HlyD family secretion protein